MICVCCSFFRNAKKVGQSCLQCMQTLGETGPAVEVPLDGTVYDLQTGKVSLACR